MIAQFEQKHYAECVKFSRQIYYPLLWESDSAFQTKLDVFPKGCVVYLDETEVKGYGFGHPWRTDHIVALDEHIELPENPTCYYIHDIAVDPQFRNKGIGRALVEHQIKIGKELKLHIFLLVSVLQSEKFWEKFGFKKIKEIEYVKDVPGIIMEVGDE